MTARRMAGATTARVDRVTTDEGMPARAAKDPATAVLPAVVPELSAAVPRVVAQTDEVPVDLAAQVVVVRVVPMDFQAAPVAVPEDRADLAETSMHGSTRSIASSTGFFGKLKN